MAIRSIHLAATASLLLAGAAVLPAHAQVQVITPTPVQSSEVVIAPNAPPPPRMETIPAPPEQTMYLASWPLDVVRRELGLGVR